MPALAGPERLTTSGQVMGTLSRLVHIRQEGLGLFQGGIQSEGEQGGARGGKGVGKGGLGGKGGKGSKGGKGGKGGQVRY